MGVEMKKILCRPNGSLRVTKDEENLIEKQAKQAKPLITPKDLRELKKKTGRMLKSKGKLVE